MHVSPDTMRLPWIRHFLDSRAHQWYNRMALGQGKSLWKEVARDRTGGIEQPIVSETNPAALVPADFFA